jgi:predicted nucleotidyltransferase
VTKFPKTEHTVGSQPPHQNEPSAKVRTAVVAVLERHPFVTLAMLLGSLVTGRRYPDSDFDLAVHSTVPLTDELASR